MRASPKRGQTGAEYILIIAAIILLAVLVFMTVRTGMLVPGANVVRNNTGVFVNYITCGYSSTCGCANQPCCSGDSCAPQYYCKSNIGPPPTKTCVGR